MAGTRLASRLTSMWKRDARKLRIEYRNGPRESVGCGARAAIVDVLPLTLLVVDHDMRVAWASPRARRKWEAVPGKGFNYGDAAATSDGAKKIILKAGAGGKAKAIVKGTGANLPDFDLDTLVLPLNVQLVKDGGAPCLGAMYEAGDVLAQDAGKLKVKR